VKRPLLLGFALVVAGAGGALAGEMVFPEHPGTDQFDTTKSFWEIQDNFGQVHMIECGGPEMWGRGMPDPLGARIPVEILQMDLQCSGGVSIHLDPTRPSRGQIMKSGESFFDVFVEIDGLQTPTGRDDATNPQPLRLQGTVAHVPPYGALYFNIAPVPLLS
jgi:hypothetical protein